MAFTISSSDIGNNTSCENQKGGLFNTVQLWFIIPLLHSLYTTWFSQCQVLLALYLHFLFPSSPCCLLQSTMEECLPGQRLFVDNGILYGDISGAITVNQGSPSINGYVSRVHMLSTNLSHGDRCNITMSYEDKPWLQVSCVVKGMYSIGRSILVCMVPVETTIDGHMCTSISSLLYKSYYH